jgi:hypothetical protein
VLKHSGCGSVSKACQTEDRFEANYTGTALRGVDGPGQEPRKSRLEEWLSALIEGEPVILKK